MAIRNPDFVSRSIGGEAVLVPITRQGADLESIFTLNTVGAFIWAELETTQAEDDIVRAVVDEFDVDQAQAAADVAEFLAQLREIGAVLAD